MNTNEAKEKAVRHALVKVMERIGGSRIQGRMTDQQLWDGIRKELETLAEEASKARAA